MMATDADGIPTGGIPVSPPSETWTFVWAEWGGGSGSKEFNSLGQQAAELVRKFVHDDGKGIIGICAGGFLLSTTPGYPSLKIFPEPDIRDGYYDRGRGLIAFFLNEQGKEIFPELENLDTLYVQYYDGPIFKFSESSSDFKGDFRT